MLGSPQDHRDHSGKAKISQAWPLTRALILSLNKGQASVPAPAIPSSPCANRKGRKRVKQESGCIIISCK